MSRIGSRGRWARVLGVTAIACAAALVVFRHRHHPLVTAVVPREWRHAVRRLLLERPPPLLPGDVAASRFRVPDGFVTTLFAGEPSVVQPIALATDDRGRLWVAESLTYPTWGGEPRDRVVILDDRDGDGRHDNRTVFASGLENLTAVEWGFGGVWLMTLPKLVFIPDRDGDDIPDGPPELVVDGWDAQPGLAHHVPTHLTWGPDGWLYGSMGFAAKAEVGPPSAPPEQRVRFHGGVWRLHPRTKRFEVVADGMVNPWGIDFDEQGELFAVSCVLDHLWHVVLGGIYERWTATGDSRHIPGLYGRLPSCVDHRHWDPNLQDDAAAGGHAHAGLLVYQGGRWPEEYRHAALMCNLHGRRLNRDTLVSARSTFRAVHAADFAQAGDTWFRGLELEPTADGNVYVSDWSEYGPCHNTDGTIDASTGRIFKISYGGPAGPCEDIGTQADDRLVSHLRAENVWLVRHASRRLQERDSHGLVAPAVWSEVERLAESPDDEVLSLRAVWLLARCGRLTDEAVARLLRSPHPSVRCWAIRVLAEEPRVPEIYGQLDDLLRREDEPVVRRSVAAALSRLPADVAASIAMALARSADDADDPLIPFFAWQGLLPALAARPELALESLQSAAMPAIVEWSSRWLTDAEVRDGGAAAQSIKEVLRGIQARPALLQAAAYRGLEASLRGSLRPPPDGWEDTRDAAVRSGVDELSRSVLTLDRAFVDPARIGRLRGVAVDTQAAVEERREALVALARAQDAETWDIAVRLLDERPLAAAALQALSECGDVGVAMTLIRRFGKLDDEAQRGVIGILIARSAFATQLINAIEGGSIPASRLTMPAAQALLELPDGSLHRRLRKLRPGLTARGEGVADEIARVGALLRETASSPPQPARGRTLFREHCGNCHELFGEGARVGPVLTGAQRSNAEYLVQHVVDPHSQVLESFQTHTVLTDDGRVVQGLCVERTPHAVTIMGPQGTTRIPAAEIEEHRVSRQSLMPEGILRTLTDQQIRDLFAYLQSPRPPEMSPR